MGNIPGETEGTALFDKITAHYCPPYEIAYGAEFDGLVIPALAQMHIREEKSIMGMMKLKSLGPEANEYAFILREESFDTDCLARVSALLETAGRELVNPGPEHAYTFLTAVVLTERVDIGATAPLKRFKLRRNFRKQGGWLITRLLVIAPDGVIYCNRDGGDLKNVMRRSLEA